MVKVKENTKDHPRLDDYLVLLKDNYLTLKEKYKEHLLRQHKETVPVMIEEPSEVTQEKYDKLKADLAKLIQEETVMNKEHKQHKESKESHKQPVVPSNPQITVG